MKMKHLTSLITAAAALALIVTPMTASAQKMKTDIPTSITTPDSVETRLGTLKFRDGIPDDATVEKVYENLDFSRGVQAFLTAMPGASLVSARRAFRELGAVNGTVAISETLLDSKALWLTPNTDTVYYPNGTWRNPLLVGGYEFLQQPGVRSLDARSNSFYYFTGITPAMSRKMIGIGSQYAYTFVDAEGKLLDGSKTYKVHLPPNIPAKNFWSIMVYDNQTRSELQADQRYPSLGSQKKDLVINADTSVDVWFGPTAPAGHEANWIQTIPGKGWNPMLRLYGPLEPWFDKTWRPGEIEEVK